MYTKIKTDIRNNIGKKVCIIVKGSRNKSSRFEGIINNCYYSIFTILGEDKSIRSFSYVDLLTNNIIIIYK